MRLTLPTVFVAVAVLFPSTPAFAEPTCDEWLRFSPSDQSAAMRTFIDKAVPKAVPPSTIDCLRSINDEIALHATMLCKHDGGDFIPSATTAIVTAIQYCQSR